MNKSSKIKSALIVVGGAAAAPAAALELGDIRVHSTIGQPLRASIAYALGPNEAIADTCVTLQPTRGATGLPSIDRGSLIVADGVIAITGNTVVREPLMSLRLNIRCPYTAQLTRDYMMLLEPAGTTPEPIVAPTPERVTSQPQLDAPPVRTERPTPAPRRSVEPIGAATQYRVRAGDSLSEIAQRIEDRPIGLWPAVEAIFAANPDAFIDNDPNKLKAGAILTIPSFGAATPLTVADAATAADAPEAAGDAATDTTADAAAEPETVTSGESGLADLQPGDLIVNGDSPFVEPFEAVGDESVVIPDTQLAGPETTSSNPNVPVQVIQPATDSSPSTTNWMLWLGGGGIGIILAMLLFGRVFRDRFAPTPVAPVVPQRRRTDVESDSIEVVEEEFGLDIPDTPETTEDVALDADLVVGSGLTETGNVDVAQDFGFAATTDLDLELPEEVSSADESQQTDNLSAISVEEHSAPEREVLSEEDDYDMSVIVDATKMQIPDDVPEHDLEAVQVDDGDEALITGDYTVSQEVDYKILEQDYEDELTATQALNAEIKKAAEDLAEDLDESLDESQTIEKPLATVHELEVTAQMKRKEDIEIADDDDTGVNPTVSFEAEDETISMTEDNTVEMPKGDKKTG